MLETKILSVEEIDAMGLLSEDQIEQTKNLTKNGNVEMNTIVRRSRATVKEDFVIAFINNLQMLADLGLSSRQIKVMLYMLKQMEYGNLLMLSQKQMEQDLKIDKGNLSRDIKSLRTKKVLVDVNGHMYVNSNLFIKGLKGGMSKERIESLVNAKDEFNGAYKSTI